MKGDRVEIVIDAGGSTRTYDIETTRGGTAVRTARFMAGRVLALVEHPAPRPVLDDDADVTPLRQTA
jgi:hypothetical protein